MSLARRFRFRKVHNLFLDVSAAPSTRRRRRRRFRYAGLCLSPLSSKQTIRFFLRLFLLRHINDDEGYPRVCVCMCVCCVCALSHSSSSRCTHARTFFPFRFSDLLPPSSFSTRRSCPRSSVVAVVVIHKPSLLPLKSVSDHDDMSHSARAHASSLAFLADIAPTFVALHCTATRTHLLAMLAIIQLGQDL